MPHNPIDSLKPAAIDSPRLLKIPEAAARLGVCPRTVQSAIARGDLRPVRIGRSVRIDTADLRAFIESCRGDTPDGAR